MYCDLLLTDQTLNSDMQCCELDRLNMAVYEKPPELTNQKTGVIHLDNARPHVSVQTRQKLVKFGWDVRQQVVVDLRPTQLTTVRLYDGELGLSGHECSASGNVSVS